ncbi:MAG: DUF1592 domain-containing protein [Myxococcota bacterium]
MTACLALSLAAMPACYSGVGLDNLDVGIGTGPGGGTDDDDAGSEDDGPPPAAACLEGGVGEQPLRRLTRSQYNNVVRDLLGIEGDPAAVFPADEKLGSFYSNGVAPVSDLLVEQYMDVAEELATEAVTDLGTLLPCDPGMMGEDACADEFIESFGRRALRRPLEAAELQQLRDLFATGRDEESFDDGIRLVVQALLQSPYLLYHVELGVEPGVEPGEPAGAGELKAPLGQYELASRLSFFLWDTMPDDDLLDAADASELSTPEQLRAQAERMLADPRARDAIASFHLQWMGIDDLAGSEKDPDLFPGYDQALKQAMEDETANFANWVILEGDGRLETLLSAPMSVIDGPLFELYGMEPPADYVPGEPVDLPADERAGLLTHASVLAKNAHVDQSSPVHRGVMVRQNVMCQALPPAPEDVDNVPPDPDPNATTRERFAEHLENEACAECHRLIDGIGFGFEHYDAVGAYRTKEGDLPVDATGEVIAAGESDGPFDGAVELAQRLAVSDVVRQCTSQQWFNFALGRVPGEEDECSTDQLHQTFVDSDYDVRELIFAVVTTDAFRFRKLSAE